MATADEESVSDAQNEGGIIERLRMEFGFIKGNFLILVFSWILMDFAREIPSTYYGLYVKELGGSAYIVGLIAFASMIAQALVQFPGGYLADKYVLQHDNVVPDPGFKSVEEIKQVIEILEGDLTLSDVDLERIEGIRAEVGTSFCRRCGYCMPCPQGVLIPNVMCLPVLYNVWPDDYIPQWGYIEKVTASAENCVGCGECEVKCPYGLPIREMMRENIEYHKRFLEGRR